jgi:hypothetical protein
MIISDAEFDRLPASEQSRYMRIRLPDGTPEWRLRSDQTGARPAGLWTDEQYQAASPAARWAYARSHDQSQFKNGSDR